MESKGYLGIDVSKGYADIVLLNSQGKTLIGYARFSSCEIIKTGTDKSLHRGILELNL